MVFDLIKASKEGKGRLTYGFEASQRREVERKDLFGSSENFLAGVSSHLLEQAWKEMAQTFTEANFGNIQEILEAEPSKWLADCSFILHAL
ncbi:hypothetical protein L484_017548 [Morus notabilis]|uniref:Uncharacterized protein n=1 Tax=Morus notabilis TaxID=981085 RepID=W9R1N0_9ROSA|nr:hypothetical protein L484_017548 [Morus notabilis]